MTSAELKYAILWRWRFAERAKYVCTEYGSGSGNIRDVFVIDRNDVCIEFECKTSAADFKADFRKHKHVMYKLYPNDPKITPMMFYFVFPHDLTVDESLLADYPDYGIIRVSPAEKPMDCGGANYAEYFVGFEKHAGFLCERRDGDFRRESIEKILRKVLMRMTSEIVGLHGKAIL